MMYLELIAFSFNVVKYCFILRRRKMIDHVGLTRDANRDRDNYIMENLEDLFFTKWLLGNKVKKKKLWVGVMSSNN
jgi:hypothetical protein